MMYYMSAALTFLSMFDQELHKIIGRNVMYPESIFWVIFIWPHGYLQTIVMGILMG